MRLRPFGEFRFGTTNGLVIDDPAAIVDHEAAVDHVVSHAVVAKAGPCLFRAGLRVVGQEPATGVAGQCRLDGRHRLLCPGRRFVRRMPAGLEPASPGRG